MVVSHFVVDKGFGVALLVEVTLLNQSGDKVCDAALRKPPLTEFPDDFLRAAFP